MDMKKWIKLQEREAIDRANQPHIIIDDHGEERDIMMSQTYADEYFFNLANGDLEKIIPKFDLDSAIYSLAHNCLVRLYLTLGKNTVDELIEQSKSDAERLQREWDDETD
jgi:hypothetical protein